MPHRHEKLAHHKMKSKPAHHHEKLAHGGPKPKKTIHDHEKVAHAKKPKRKVIVRTKKILVEKGPKKKLVGTVAHFFDRISVAVVDLKAPVKQGDKISFEGPKTNFEQSILSMQVEHKPVKAAKKGESIGLKVVSPVKEKDLVFMA